MKHIQYLISLTVIGALLVSLYVVGYHNGNSPVNGLELKNHYLQQKRLWLERENEMLKLHIKELEATGGSSYKC